MIVKHYRPAPTGNTMQSVPVLYRFTVFPTVADGSRIAWMMEDSLILQGGRVILVLEEMCER